MVRIDGKHYWAVGSCLWRNPPKPKPKPTPSPTKKEVYYANCDAVRKANKDPLLKGQPGYRTSLDRDGDGKACESGSSGGSGGGSSPTPDISGTAVWDKLAECESGGRWDYNGSSGYDGGLQFLPSTWLAYGGDKYAQYAYQATREEQIDIAEKVRADVGYSAWPACSQKLGL